jgi:hypothetical protein
MGWKPTGADANAIHYNFAVEIVAVTEKATPVSADLVLIEDSAASNAKKRVQVGNLPGGSGGAISSARVSLTANEALNNGSATPIPWDQADWDDASYWSAGSPILLTIPASGRYRITCAWILSVAVTAPNVSIQHNDGGGFAPVAWALLLSGSGNNARAGTVTAVIEASSGDTLRTVITVFVGSITLQADRATWLAIERIG